QMHTEWKRVDQGGLEDIEEWAKSVKDPRLIWIDTLAKIRPVASRNEPAYTADYRAIEGLQRLAGEDPGLGIVLNPPLRKMSCEDDAFDDVSGTLGLTGAADTIVVMKRHSGMVKVFVRGRDIEEGEFAAEFNRTTCRWRIVGGADDVFRSKERQAILAALKSTTEPMSIPDIMAATERTDRSATKALLHKMRTDGEVVSAKGRYSLARAVPPLNSVDRVDRDVSGATEPCQPIDEAGGISTEERSTEAVNGRSTVNAALTEALTGDGKSKSLNGNENGGSGQRVNAVNGIESGEPPAADPGIPESCRRCDHCGRSGTAADRLLPYDWPGRPDGIRLHPR